MHVATPALALALAITGCGVNESASSTSSARGPSSAASASASGQPTTASTTVGGVTLQTSTVAIQDLNVAIAGRYGIDRSRDGVLLLVTVRDAAGNAADPGGLQLQATAGSLTEAPQPLPLRAITTNGMTDYIGAFHTGAPATVQFRLVATRGGSRAEIATTAELYPR